MAAHSRDDDDIWIVYDSREFVAMFNNEHDAEMMCSWMGEFHTWKRFTHNTDKEQG